MSAIYGDIPTVPTKILQIRRGLHNQPGLHNILDVPVDAIEQHAPHAICSNATISLLFYTLGDSYATFRVAIGHHFVTNQSDFFEVGTFADDNRVKCSTKSSSSGYYDTKKTIAAKTFYWIQFVREDKDICILFNGEGYYRLTYKPDVPVFDGIITWTNIDLNIACFECHFTCDQSNVSTLLPMNEWLNSDELNTSRSFHQSVNFKLGGSMTILGTYKKTGQGDDKIKLAFKKGSSTSTATIDPPSDRTANTMLHLTIQGGELVLIFQGTHKTVLTGVDGTHTVPVKIVENFHVISVCM
ncbi:uncharacterized protein LOC135376020 isoform X2 [Ornithodoros turicata]